MGKAFLFSQFKSIVYTVSRLQSSQVVKFPKHDMLAGDLHQRRNCPVFLVPEAPNNAMGGGKRRGKRKVPMREKCLCRRESVRLIDMRETRAQWVRLESSAPGPQSPLHTHLCRAVNSPG